MGFLDSILKTKEEEKKPSAFPFKIALRFHPVRLSAMTRSSIDLVVKITNTTNESQLVSVDAVLPKKELLGFEPTCISKHHEKKAGKIIAGETSEVSIPIWATNQTKDGQYPIAVTIYSHYINYDKVISSIQKKTFVRVV